MTLFVTSVCVQREMLNNCLCSARALCVCVCVCGVCVCVCVCVSVCVFNVYTFDSHEKCEYVLTGLPAMYSVRIFDTLEPKFTPFMFVLCAEYTL